ncbi:MAG: long-chain fatty acid--CoA ligase [Desulfurococcales archaeon]|nr:long-chain fatty acid--CoA ligase [Desulfurococcales archaeon]
MTLPEKVPVRPGYEVTLDWIYKRALQLFPDMEIVYRTKKGVERYSFSEAADRIAKLASALSSLGVGKLDRVATLDWNTHWHYEAYFAVPMMGAVLHPINIRLAPAEIAYVMSQAEDKVVITNSDFLKLVEVVAPKVPSLESVIVVDSDSAPEKVAGLPVYHYEDFIREHSSSFEWPQLSEDQPAAMGYTSGTTGLPKGAYHSHKAMVLHAMSGALHLATISKDFRLSSQNTILHIVPMFHVYSWGLPYIATLLGMKQVYPNKLEPEVLLKLIVDEKVDFTAGVPTILYMLLAHPASEKYDLSGLTFVNGGSALPRGLAELALKRGMRVFVGYGMTETAPILTLASPPAKTGVDFKSPNYLDYALRTGWPIPLIDLQVVDPEMKPVPKDGKTMGEIVVRGPWITPEYYKNPEKTEAAWRGGWFHTGDIAVWYPDGSIVIVDRDKDVIKSGGEWISSVRLEDAISRHECVAQVAVIAAKHPKWQERPVALVVPKPGCEDKISTESINEFLTKNFVETGQIPKWWLPDKVLVVEDLPKTSVGKINKRALREKYANILLEEA